MNQREAEHDGEPIEVGVVARRENRYHQESKTDRGNKPTEASEEDRKGQDQFDDVHREDGEAVKPLWPVVSVPGRPGWNRLSHVMVGHGRILGRPFRGGITGPGEFYPSGKEHQFCDEDPEENEGNSVDETEARRVRPGRAELPAGEKYSEKSRLKQQYIPLETHENAARIHKGEVNDPEQNQRWSRKTTDYYKDRENGPDEAEKLQREIARADQPEYVGKGEERAFARRSEPFLESGMQIGGRAEPFFSNEQTHLRPPRCDRDEIDQTEASDRERASDPMPIEIESENGMPGFFRQRGDVFLCFESDNALFDIDTDALC